jgi:hypothetical protein
MTSAIIDDIASLVAVAVLIPVVTSSQSLSVESVLVTGGKAAPHISVRTRRCAKPAVRARKRRMRRV